mmetsp:Transcript_12150/g.10469  ORF Transcript_12150/g.10469 Transcript_12150/m.10469 type:complete len:82 (-) Transcript_12150:2522-2767(-)
MISLSIPRKEKILKKTLINMLLGHYWTDMTHIKSVLKDEILKNVNDLEKIVEEVTILDPKKKMIRIKDTYSESFDPYIFYR